jgi:hypothetical protein
MSIKGHREIRGNVRQAVRTERPLPLKEPKTYADR